MRSRGHSNPEEFTPFYKPFTLIHAILTPFYRHFRDREEASELEALRDAMHKMSGDVEVAEDRAEVAESLVESSEAR